MENPVEGPDPLAPDYALAANWCLDSGPQSGDRTLPADVFFVHPTGYFGARWNAALSGTLTSAERGANKQADELHRGAQAGVFSSCCRIFSPRYRQMTYLGHLHEDAPRVRQAYNLAYGDVRRAFEVFAKQLPEGRPWFLASHSQGTQHAARLLREVVDATPRLARSCVCAYLIGFAIPLAALKGFQHFTASSGPASLQSIVSWNLRGGASAEEGEGEEKALQYADMKRGGGSYADMERGGPGFWAGPRKGWVDPGDAPILQVHKDLQPAVWIP